MSHVVFWSPEDEGFIAHLDGMPSFSAWGQTEEEAIAELNIASEVIKQECESQLGTVPCVWDSEACRYVPTMRGVADPEIERSKWLPIEEGTHRCTLGYPYGFKEEEL